MEDECDSYDDLILSLQSLTDSLIDVSKSIDKKRKDLNGSESQTTRRLISFKAALPETDRIFIFSIFRKLFNEHRSSIIRGPNYDAWLRAYSINKKIYEMNGKVDSEPLKKEIKICLPASKKDKKKNPPEIRLSELYNSALDIADKIQLDLDGPTNDEKIDNAFLNCRELILPRAIRLYLWRCFAHSAPLIEEPEGTSESIHSALRPLESDLGIESEGGVANIGQVFETLMNDNSPIAKLLDSIRPMLKSVGLDMDPREIVDMAKSLAVDGADSSENIITKLISMFTKKTDSNENTIGSLMTKMGDAMKDPSKHEFFSKLLERAKVIDSSKTSSEEFMDKISQEIENPEVIAEIQKLTNCEDIENVKDETKRFLSFVQMFKGLDFSGFENQKKKKNKKKKPVAQVIETTPQIEASSSRTTSPASDIIMNSNDEDCW